MISLIVGHQLNDGTGFRDGRNAREEAQRR